MNMKNNTKRTRKAQKLLHGNATDRLRRMSATVSKRSLRLTLLLAVVAVAAASCDDRACRSCLRCHECVMCV